MGQIHNSEQLGQRIHDCRLMETRQLDEVFSQLGGKSVDLETFKSTLLQKEHLTNWQMTRLLEGHRKGFIYGEWIVLYLVGAGTFARVYRAVNRKTADIKAVKVLRNRYANDVDTQESFRVEAETVMKLRHPNIVPIYEVANDEHGRTYMVMDFIEGQNLRDFVKAHGKLTIANALKIVRDIAAGLKFAAEQGIAHRDIKLSNVLLSTRGKACIVDFGLAVIEQQAANRDGVNPRSVDYAGLEKMTHVDRNDKRSDIFFVGCILYQLISGEPPLKETKHRIERMSPDRFRNIRPITQLVPRLSHRTVVLLNKMLELDPAKRIQSPTEALRDIETVITSMEKGGDQEYSEELAARDAANFKRKTEKANEGADFKIMLIESHADIQNFMREKLRNLGYRVLIINDPRRAISRFQDLDPAEERPADCVIFGCAGLGHEGLESFNFFATDAWTQDVPAILLLTEKQSAKKNTANLADHRLVGEMPIKFRQVRHFLRQLLNIENGESV